LGKKRVETIGHIPLQYYRFTVTDCIAIGSQSPDFGGGESGSNDLTVGTVAVGWYAFHNSFYLGMKSEV
jgi:hypothetical protein